MKLAEAVLPRQPQSSGQIAAGLKTHKAQQTWFQPGWRFPGRWPERLHPGGDPPDTPEFLRKGGALIRSARMVIAQVRPMVTGELTCILGEHINDQGLPGGSSVRISCSGEGSFDRWSEEVPGEDQYRSSFLPGRPHETGRPVAMEKVGRIGQSVSGAFFRHGIT